MITLAARETHLAWFEFHLAWVESTSMIIKLPLTHG